MVIIMELQDVWKIYRMGNFDVPALQEINLAIQARDRHYSTATGSILAKKKNIHLFPGTKRQHMKILDIFRLALSHVKKSKMRSWLTIIGIVIGVAAVVAIISIGQGMQESVQASLKPGYRHV
jgi:hypothetical protein